MAVRNNGGCRRFHSRQDSIPELPAAPSSSEPAMRRWPHPTAAPPQPEATGAELYSIGCALSQQTQLLTEIRTLLERLAQGDTELLQTIRMLASLNDTSLYASFFIS